MYDKIELPKVLESMANVKRKSSFQISKCLNNKEIPSKKMNCSIIYSGGGPLGNGGLLGGGVDGNDGCWGA
jgi:hypothetical protein